MGKKLGDQKITEILRLHCAGVLWQDIAWHLGIHEATISRYVREAGLEPRHEHHGMAYTPEHEAWMSMRDRCENPNSRNYKNYGGRGITVCARWQSFGNFFADVGNRPSEEYSLDRIDNNKGYECGQCEDCASRGTTKMNCRWATRIEQARNNRRSRLIELDGETKCLQEWAQQYGLHASRILLRLRYGWPIDLAIKTPVGSKHPDLKLRREPVSPKMSAMSRAYVQVHKAIREGILVPPAQCAVPDCPAVRVEAHHYLGYEMPLDLVWLCKPHHTQAERGILDLTDLPKSVPPSEPMSVKRCSRHWHITTEMILAAYQETGNWSAAARKLGVSRTWIKVNRPRSAPQSISAQPFLPDLEPGAPVARSRERKESL